MQRSGGHIGGGLDFVAIISNSLGYITQGDGNPSQFIAGPRRFRGRGDKLSGAWGFSRFAGGVWGL